jgi:hypothetical protein
MGFLTKLEAVTHTISLDEVFKNDPQYQELVDSVAELVRRLSDKFGISEKMLYEFFVKHLKEEL